MASKKIVNSGLLVSFITISPSKQPSAFGRKGKKDELIALRTPH
jgi:hypothetical protein